MKNEHAAKLAFLRASEAFDGVLEVIETHMSWVFLTQRHAFKLKKPVHLPFVDYRTLARRKQSCENELRLGRRLAVNVYDAVVPLVTTPSGLAIGGAGEVVDWLVVMRRLARDRMLPEMLAHGEATGDHADAVADILAHLYGTSPRTAWDPGEYRRRLCTQVRSTGDELLDRGASPAQVDRIVCEELVGIGQEAHALEARIARGYVVDAHGDLRPEHVCLEMPPVIIDPLEFDDDLRTLDTISELAFFALECERIGASWFAERVLARYAAVSGDPMPLPLRTLYRAQHALTRALIALRHVEDADECEQPRWRMKAEDYLARATSA